MADPMQVLFETGEIRRAAGRLFERGRRCDSCDSCDSCDIAMRCGLLCDMIGWRRLKKRSLHAGATKTLQRAIDGHHPPLDFACCRAPFPDHLVQALIDARDRLRKLARCILA